MKRKLLIASLLILCVSIVVFAQSRMRAHGAQIIIGPTGAIGLTPASGQGTAINSGLNVTGNTTLQGYATVAGQGTFTKDPANTTNTSASLLVNPATSASNEFLFVVADNGTSRFTVDKEGDTTAVTMKVGSTGTALTKAAKYTATLSPAEVAANTCAEELFTVTGVAAGDVVTVNKPTAQAGLGIGGVRASGTNQVGINFCNNTASPITPTAGEVYLFTAIQ